MWKYHPDCNESEKKHQINKMKELYQVTGSLSRPLMLELIIPDLYETNGHSLSLSMKEVYEAGIFPEWWKIAPVDSGDEWEQIQSVINKYDPKELQQQYQQRSNILPYKVETQLLFSN